MSLLSNPNTYHCRLFLDNRTYQLEMSWDNRSWTMLSHIRVQPIGHSLHLIDNKNSRMLWAVCIRCCYTKQCMDLLEESRSFISSNSCKTKRTIIIILLLVHVQRNVEPLAWHVKSLFEKKKRLAYYMK
jgi:hypothetical protein